MIVVKSNESRLRLAWLVLNHNKFVVPISAGSSVLKPKTLERLGSWGVKNIDVIHDVFAGNRSEYEALFEAYSVASQCCDVDRLWLDVSSCHHAYSVEPFVKIVQEKNIHNVGLIVKDHLHSGKLPVWLRAVGRDKLYRSEVCDLVEFERGRPVSSQGLVRWPE